MMIKKVYSQKLRQMYQNCTNVEGVLAHSQKSSEQLVRFLTVLVKNGGVPPTLQNVPSAF